VWFSASANAEKRAEKAVQGVVSQGFIGQNAGKQGEFRVESVIGLIGQANSAIEAGELDEI